MCDEFTTAEVFKCKLDNFRGRIQDVANVMHELQELFDASRDEERQRIYNAFRCSACGGNGNFQLVDGYEFGVCEMCGGTGIVDAIRTWSDFERRLQ